MSRLTTISFVIKGKIEGISISPDTISFSQFNEFNRQVEDFITGSQHVRLDEVHVKVDRGSYKLVVALPLIIFSSLQSDLKALAHPDSLGEIDPKRQEVIARWQARSKQFSDWAYEIAPTDKSLPKIEISQQSNFRMGSTSPWVAVEKYLFGQVVDMGGAQKANVHLRLEDTGKIVTLGSSQGYLEEQAENRLYRKVLVQVRAEQHLTGGDLRNLQLISFLDYSPQYNESALDAFAANGREAWADVDDPAAWVREIRGES